jgi:glutamyl/glutaminyl-tRNA synthetase
MTTKNQAEEKTNSLNFIESIIENDIKNNKNEKRVHTRFPPEPNGYLHIGHAKSICLNFGLAKRFGGKCNLRFDDTNPTKEEVEYVDSIMEDVRWLGFEWDGDVHYASDYFDQLYLWAEKMILDGKAYVDDQTSEQIASQKGTPTVPGKESPFRNRTPKENLELFRKMRAGEYKDGEKILRAKIDMASSNMHMRDPIMYRIIHKEHHRTGNKWCIYPMYDFTHGQSDYIEGITHSVCTLEFEVHRPLYNWYLDQLIDTEYRPQQIEFARLNLSYTVMSKRKLLELVQNKYVSGWDDPRMPTVSGMRRRGYTPNKFFRLTIGKEVRLKGAYIIKAERVIKDAEGKITEIQCTYDPESRSGSGSEASKRKVKATIHWVEASQAVPIVVRQYDRLFNHEDPGGQEDDFKNYLNKESLKTLTHCLAEPAIKNLKKQDRVQFQRQGYFCVDLDSSNETIIFNRTVTLKDDWAKLSSKND